MRRTHTRRTVGLHHANAVRHGQAVRHGVAVRPGEDVDSILAARDPHGLGA